MEKRDNYALAVIQAKKLFLDYDQQELISRCRLKHDDTYFYLYFLGFDYRICRKTGDMERFQDGTWIDGNAFGEVMTIFDWMCDSRADRYITGRWTNILTQGNYFHRSLQEEPADPLAEYFNSHPEQFDAACTALHGKKGPGGDRSYVVELVDGLCILIQFWFGDEEFPPKLRFLWDENTIRYIRYETTWYALGLLRQRLREAI